jgi:hypothetical protein
MLIRILLAGAMLLSVTAIAAAQKACERYSELGVPFSICPPAGWVISARTGEQFKIFTAPGAGTFRPNVNFREEASSSSLDDYVDAAAKLVLSGAEKLGAASINLKSRSAFETDAGAKGVKLVFLVDFRGNLIRITQYLFNGRFGYKLVMTCTAGEDAQLDSFFDASAKSLIIER